MGTRSGYPARAQVWSDTLHYRERERVPVPFIRSLFIPQRGLPGLVSEPQVRAFPPRAPVLMGERGGSKGARAE